MSDFTTSYNQLVKEIKQLPDTPYKHYALSIINIPDKVITKQGKLYQMHTQKPFHSVIIGLLHQKYRSLHTNVYNMSLDDIVSVLQQAKVTIDCHTPTAKLIVKSVEASDTRGTEQLLESIANLLVKYDYMTVVRGTKNITSTAQHEIQERGINVHRIFTLLLHDKYPRIEELLANTTLQTTIKLMEKEGLVLDYQGRKGFFLESQQPRQSAKETIHNFVAHIYVP